MDTDEVRDARSELVASWRSDDGDGIGYLRVRASFDGFAGDGGAWFDGMQVLEFAGLLMRYPLEAGEPASLSGGLGAGEDFVEAVGLSVAPVGALGQLGCRVHLRADLADGRRPAVTHEVRLVLLTTYQRLGTFARDLSDLIEGSAEYAVLGGEVLA